LLAQSRKAPRQSHSNDYFGTEKVTPHAANEDCANITVDMNGCDYDLTGNTTGKDTGSTDATVWVKCPVGKEITITTTSAARSTSTTRHRQKAASHTRTKPWAAKSHQNRNYMDRITCTAPGLACLFTGFPSESNGFDYTGTEVVACFDDKAGPNIRSLRVRRSTAK
jgi:hypothetical protein